MQIGKSRVWVPECKVGQGVALYGDVSGKSIRRFGGAYSAIVLDSIVGGAGNSEVTVVTVTFGSCSKGNIDPYYGPNLGPGPPSEITLPLYIYKIYHDPTTTKPKSS